MSVSDTTDTRELSGIITLDDREGSRDLAPHLRDIGLRIVLGRLEYGDVAFEGWGPGGVRTTVGIEHKTLADLCNSYRTQRLEGHQAPGMTRVYGPRYLIIQGDHTEDPDTGLIQVPARGGWKVLSLGSQRFTYREVDNFLTSLENFFDLRVRKVRDEWMSAVTIRDLYRYWTKPWEEHQTGRTIYTPPPDEVMYTKPSYLRRAAYQLDGVGWKLSGEIEGRFRSAVSMVMADVDEWLQIEGIGKVRAERIVRELGGERIKR